MSLSIADQKRIINSLRNIVSSVGAQFVLGIAAFVERTFFLKTLSADYLGLNTLFANVLVVLSIAELGIGSAISFALYKPLAERDDEKIASLMYFFKKAYFIIGLIIIAVGSVLSFVIPYFARGANIEFSAIQKYFMLYLFAVGLTYFFSYKQILLEADQKRYINQIVVCLGSVVQYILQICILLLTHNYALYIVVFIFVNVGKNIVISHLADKIFPVLRKNKKEIRKLQGSEKRKIVTNIKAVCLQKLGEVGITSSDSLLISILIDVRTLGLYANYQIITTAVQSSLSIFYSSTLASIGNLCAVDDKEKAYYAFRSLDFVNYILFSYATIVIFNIVQPIISLWLGPNYLLSGKIVLWASLAMYMFGSRRMSLNFHSAYGLFWADRYKRIIEASVNIVASIIFAHFFGLAGIFAGTVLSYFIGFLIGGRVLFKYGFQKKFVSYLLLYLARIITTVIILIIVAVIALFIPSSSLLIQLIINIILCLFVPPCLYFLLYRKNNDFIVFKRNVVEFAHTVFMKKRL